MKITPETAEDTLKRYPDMHPTHAAYFEAAIAGEMPEFYLSRFQDYRHNCSDDLPEPDVSPEHPDYEFLRLKATEDHHCYPRMKCRGNFIVGMSGHLQGAIIDEVIIDQEMIKTIESFRNSGFNFSRGKKGGFWTLPEEIELMNGTLDIVIEHIKETYSL